MVKLNIGCGKQKISGYVSVDSNAKYEPDLLWDVDEAPPQEIVPGSVDEVLLYNVLEHTQDPFVVLQRLHFLCRDGAVIHIRVPYFNSVTAAGDMTHTHFFGFTSFDCLGEYGENKFEVEISDEPGAMGKMLPRGLRKYLSLYVGNLIRALVIELKVQK